MTHLNKYHVFDPEVDIYDETGFNIWSPAYTGHMETILSNVKFNLIL